MSDEITIPELNTVSTIQEDDAIMLTHQNGVTEKIAASNLTARDTFIIAATPTVTGPTLGTGFAVRIYFTEAVTGLNGSSAMVINYNNTDYNVKVAKNGALINFVAQEFTENNVTVYKYLQAYTVLELFYNGTDFVIVGNPIVLSGNDYKIYADGSKLVDTVADDNMNSVTSNAVFNFIKIKDFKVYFRDLTWSAGSMGGYWANISINNHITNFNKIISVMSKNWSGVDCRGLFIGLDNNASEITIVVESKGNESLAFIDFRVLYI